MEIKHPTFAVGDVVSMMVPPKLTLWDRFLWRFFRIHRKREPLLREFQVVATYTD